MIAPIVSPSPYLGMLSRVMTQMTSVRRPDELDEVLRTITAGLVESSDLAVASIWLYITDAECLACRSLGRADANDRMLHMVASAGVRDSEAMQRHHRVPLGLATVGQCARHRRAVIANDLQGKARRLQEGTPVSMITTLEGEVPDIEVEWVLEHGFDGSASFPLVMGDDLVGVLGVLARRPVDEQEAAFIGIFAQQAAISIKSAQLLRHLDRLNDRLAVENAYLQEEIRAEGGFDEIIGASPTLRDVLRMVRQVAPTESTVLLLGETGTGKELVARAIHQASPRKGRPLIKVNCGAISAQLAESELFGHERGAFTGAVQRRVGRFELAHQGSLFLDEVGELPADLQVKLLRVLQEQEFERVGGTQPIRVDVRLIAATNRELDGEVAAGRFRPDLYYRLNIFPVRIPPLRERPGDIPLLVSHFVAEFGRRLGKPLEGVSRASMRQLQSYSWPGNIRELRNVIERACVLAPGRVVEVGEQLTSQASAAEAGRGSPSMKLMDQEREHIRRALELTGGRIDGPKGAAALLGLNPSTLRSRMLKLGLLKTRS